MSRVVVFGAVAGRLAAAPGHGGDGTRSKITQAKSLDLRVSKVARSLGMEVSSL